jgi:hypothetical protein
MNSLTIYALGYELNDALQGITIEKIMRYPGGYTVALARSIFPFLHILHFGREPELVLSRRTIVAHEHLTHVPSALERSKIKNINPLGMDRILLFTVTAEGDWGEGEQATVRINMTPTRMPIAVFRDSGGTLFEWHGRPRARRPATSTDVPSVKPLSILSLPNDPPEEIVEAATVPSWPENIPEHTRHWEIVRRTARVLVDSVAGLDPVLATSLSRTFKGKVDTIWPHLVEIGAAVESRNFTWRRYEFPEEGAAGRCAIYPVELPVGESPVTLKSGIEAVAQRMEEIIRPSYVRFLRKAALSAARRELEKAERLAGRLAEDLEEAKRAREYRHYGKLLVTYRHLIKRGMREIAVRDFSGERTVTIPLSPQRTPDENIRRYFARAKKGEKGILIITSRKRAIERDIKEKNALFERIAKLDEPEELLQLTPHRAGGEKPIVKSPAAAPFKRFVIEEQYTIFVGRKDSENDLLTHRFAAPGDLWFHAQGVGGSHVILKGAGPSTPKRILEKAAAVAAYYSKARHSSTVPVIYTEKRYVRKPRKSPPGTAACLRGRTLYVKPALPEKKDTPRRPGCGS